MYRNPFRSPTGRVLRLGRSCFACRRLRSVACRSHEPLRRIGADRRRSPTGSSRSGPTCDPSPATAHGLDLAFVVMVPRRAGRLSLTSEAVTLGNWFATLSVHRGDWDRRPYTDVGDAFFTEVADFALNVDTVQPMELAFTDLVFKQREATRWSISISSSRRRPGPIRRGGCCEKNMWSTALLQQLLTVVMGPGLRRGDEEGYDRATASLPHIIPIRLRHDLPAVLWTPSSPPDSR